MSVLPNGGFFPSVSSMYTGKWELSAFQAAPHNFGFFFLISRVWVHYCAITYPYPLLHKKIVPTHISKCHFMALLEKKTGEKGAFIWDICRERT